MTDAKRSAFDAHAAWLRKLLGDGSLIAASPCLRKLNTGIAIFEAPSREAAQRIVAGEPVTSGGYMRGDLRWWSVRHTSRTSAPSRHARIAASVADLVTIATAARMRRLFSRSRK